MKIVVDIPKKYYEDFKLQLPILNIKTPSELAKYVIATGTVIETLKQESCDDAISRQAVLDALESIGSLDTEADREYARSVFEELPSVKPQYTDDEIQKMQEMQQAEIEKAYELGKAEQLEMGQWINNHNNTISCDRCHTWFNKDDRYGYMHYCPNCGLKMREVEE